MAFHDQKFKDRHEKSQSISYQLMEKLFESKNIEAFFKTKKEIDIEGTDYYVSFEQYKRENIQFKIRMDQHKDIPVTRLQPFKGFGEHTVGRDFISIMEEKNKFYFVALRNSKKEFEKITVTDAMKLKLLIQEAEQEWFPDSVPWAYITPEMYHRWAKKKKYSKRLKVAKNGLEAFFKKNAHEDYGKINIYIPHRYIDKTFKL